MIENTRVPSGTALRGTWRALSSLIVSHLAHDKDLVTACCAALHSLTDLMAG